MQRNVRLATVTLNQLVLDFKGNYERIRDSILEAFYIHHADYRVGPELEVSGYNCQDHFLERDTVIHSWECLIQLMEDTKHLPIICDVGMPVEHKSVLYNCRIIFRRGIILFIRPKRYLCDEGNYRETRWFASWKKHGIMETFRLPSQFATIIGQEECQIGDVIIQFKDTTIGFEICEELWAPRPSHQTYFIRGAEIVFNSSGSHHELRKHDIREQLIRTATKNCGGVYVYSNLRGCDGERVWYDGGSFITMNGRILSRGEQFSLMEVEVVSTEIDLNDIIVYRSTKRSFHQQNSEEDNIQLSILKIEQFFHETIDWSSFKLPKLFEKLSLIEVDQFINNSNNQSISQEIAKYSVEEEIEYAPAQFLWDFLRRSNQAGFLLPLSGGVDSSSTATLVYSMCRLIFQHLNGSESFNKNIQKEMLEINRRKVVEDLKKSFFKSSKGNDESTFPILSSEQLCHNLLVTVYMGKIGHSSMETRKRAETLSNSIGSTFLQLDIDQTFNALKSTVADTLSIEPKFDGNSTEQLSLQNMQARLRMVFAYSLAQLQLFSQEKIGSRLVLGSSNVEECLRGYMTKYDCSSADVNPIGGICKADLKSFLLKMTDKYENLSILKEIVEATPTAELLPLSNDDNLVQTDEDEMGLSYEELNQFARLRRQWLCGPVSMFEKMKSKEMKLINQVPMKQIRSRVISWSEKVKRFFYYYSINRHKMTIMTPSYHAESYSADDNRFDQRPFLYPSEWHWQFRDIDIILSKFLNETEILK
ncbi:hypothetical protein SNEBB_002310 [Seison nebaliae]|nr:hypothetical protein SNEBB_002310 [Seison nebaliae]